MSPFEASSRVTWVEDADGVFSTARVNRFGIGHGQAEYWDNKHFPDLASARSAFEAMLADLRADYGTPGKIGATGRFVEIRRPIQEGVQIIDEVHFVPILKSGRRGKTVHTVQLYPIDLPPSFPDELSEVLKVPVS